MEKNYKCGVHISKVDLFYIFISPGLTTLLHDFNRPLMDVKLVFLFEMDLFIGLKMVSCIFKGGSEACRASDGLGSSGPPESLADELLEKSRRSASSGKVLHWSVCSTVMDNGPTRYSLYSQNLRNGFIAPTRLIGVSDFVSQLFLNQFSLRHDVLLFLISQPTSFSQRSSLEVISLLFRTDSNHILSCNKKISPHLKTSCCV